MRLGHFRHVYGCPCRDVDRGVVWGSKPARDNPETGYQTRRHKSATERQSPIATARTTTSQALPPMRIPQINSAPPFTMICECVRADHSPFVLWLRTLLRMPIRVVCRYRLTPITTARSPISSIYEQWRGETVNYSGIKVK